MIKAYVVVEGRADAELLKRLLPKRIVQSTEFVIAGGRASAQSLALSLLVAKQMPVALVVDADTTDRARLQEEEEFLREYLSQAASGTKFEVLLTAPVNTFFSTDSTVKKTLRDPNTVAQLDEPTIKLLRSSYPLVRRLTKFLSSVITGKSHRLAGSITTS